MTDPSLFFLNLAQLIPPDGGPVYTETDLSRSIAEPWNAVSSLFIAAPGIYWAIRLKGQYKKYSFLTICLALLITGGTGSALYHAFRTSRFLLLMDILPAALVTLLVGIHFWLKILKKWWYVILVVIPFLLMRIIIFEYLPRHAAINVSYITTGIMIFLPLFILMIRQHYFGLRPIAISILMLLLSLVFREFDVYEISRLPMGTHFLWHVFSGIGAWYLGKYLYLERNYVLK